MGKGNKFLCEVEEELDSNWSLVLKASVQSQDCVVRTVYNELPE